MDNVNFQTFRKRKKIKLKMFEERCASYMIRLNARTFIHIFFIILSVD